MYGIEVLLWGVEDSPTAGYFRMIKNYYGYGNFGHAALRFTLPCTQEVEAWLIANCYQSQADIQPAIPFVKTKTKVADSSSPTGVREEDCYEIYFSWWPNELASEQEDYESLLETVASEYSVASKAQLFPNGDIPKIKISSGQIGQMLDKIMPLFTQWSLEVDCPTLSRLHIPEGKATEYEMLAQRKLSLIKEYESLSAQVKAGTIKCDKKLRDQFRVLYQDIFSTKHELLKYESIGAQPDHVVHMPIDLKSPQGLAVMPMLDEMALFISGEYEFDIKYLNCSAAARYILLSGLQGSLYEQFKQCHGVWQALPNLIDNPTSLLGLCMKIQSAALQSPGKPLLFRQTAPEPSFEAPMPTPSCKSKPTR